MTLAAPYYDDAGGKVGRPGWLEDLLRKTVRVYQRPWLQSECPFVAILGGRQLGKDRKAGIRVGLDTAFRDGSQWHCLSASQKHANDLMREVKRFTLLFLRAAEAQGHRVPHVTINNVTEFELSNGARVVSHAATPTSAQGARGTGGVLLNEVGAMRHAEEIFETTYSIVTGQLDQGRRSKMILMGNAAHRGSFWYRFWMQLQKDKPRGWAWFEAKWSDSFRWWLRARGWPKAKIDRWVARKRKERVRRLGLGAFLQWYECVWRSPEDSFFRPELVERRTYDPDDPPEGFPSLADVMVHQTLGYDPARKTHPAGLCQVLIANGQHFGHDPRRLHGGKYKSWAAQIDEVERVFRQRQTLTAVIDETGPGDAPAQMAEERLGRRVHRFTFSQPSRLALAKCALSSLENGVAWVPNDTDFQMELSGIHTSYAETGAERLIIPINGDTHGDMAVAWMLAEWGASNGSRGEVRVPTTPRRRPSQRFL